MIFCGRRPTKVDLLPRYANLLMEEHSSMKTNSVLFGGVLMLFMLCSTAAAQKENVSKATEETLQADALIEAFFSLRTGDLPEMLAIHKIRVLVYPSRSTYFLDKKGQPRGLDYELFKRYEKLLNRERKKGTPPVTVVFIPVTIDEMGDALLDGRGDIAGLTLITSAREKQFAYTTPIWENISEVIVTVKGAPKISNVSDLSGREAYVVSGSAQIDGIAKLNKKLEKKGLKPLRVIQAEPYVTHENLLEMVHGGMIPAAVVPDAIARLWQKVFKNLVIHKDVPVRTGLKAAYAVRKDNPKLLQNMNEAIQKALGRDKRIFENKFRQYFERAHWIKNPFNKSSKFDLSTHFERQAGEFGMDWIQLMAQGFQESALNQKARSPYGAVGIMQILPSTAKWLGIQNYMELQGNIRAGAKYMKKLIDGFSKDPKISKDNQFFLALAAYNAGPGRVNTYRKRAKKMGYNPNVWFGNVERAALRSGNMESVMYVRNVMNYTMAYKSAYERFKVMMKMEKLRKGKESSNP